MTTLQVIALTAAALIIGAFLGMFLTALLVVAGSNDVHEPAVDMPPTRPPSIRDIRTDSATALSCHVCGDVMGSTRFPRRFWCVNPACKLSAGAKS